MNIYIYINIIHSNTNRLYKCDFPVGSTYVNADLSNLVYLTPCNKSKL